MGYKKVDSPIRRSSTKEGDPSVLQHDRNTHSGKNTTCVNSRDSGLAEVVSNLPAIIILTQNGEHATHYEALTIRLDKGKRRSSKLKRKT